MMPPKEGAILINRTVKATPKRVAFTPFGERR
jgi:hypothetical protein